MALLWQQLAQGGKTEMFKIHHSFNLAVKFYPGTSFTQTHLVRENNAVILQR